MPIGPVPVTEQVRSILARDSVWTPLLDRLDTPGPAPFGIHLAILVEPYLHLILNGAKTVESRFARRRCPPYGCIDAGDVVLLKRSGGPIMGVCLVSKVWFHERNGGTWQAIRDRFGTSMCAQDAAFWREREGASFATLIRISQVRSLTPAISYAKRDRRGWVIVQRAERGH